MIKGLPAGRDFVLLDLFSTRAICLHSGVFQQRWYTQETVLFYQEKLKTNFVRSQNFCYKKYLLIFAKQNNAIIQFEEILNKAHFTSIKQFALRGVYFYLGKSI